MLINFEFKCSFHIPVIDMSHILSKERYYLIFNRINESVIAQPTLRCSLNSTHLIAMHIFQLFTLVYLILHKHFEDDFYSNEFKSLSYRSWYNALQMDDSFEFDPFMTY